MGNEIKCPKCGTIFSVDETDYANLIEQVRTKEFDSAVRKETERMRNDAKKNEEIALMKVENEKNKQIEALNLQIVKLTEEIRGKEKNNGLLIEQAVAQKDKELFELRTQMQAEKEKFKSEKELLVSQHKKEIATKDETIEFYKDFKLKMSTKMVGESLEQHCENKFNELRTLAFPNASFGKDNDSSGGTKGDYIYREKTEDGTEVLSIMFEMKNEVETTATKHKNENFFAKLDKDRREKKCEYAILVSMLEPDSELYNNGIVDVSYKYEKMFVIRPQFFIPMISILRNCALNGVKYKQEAEEMRRQNIDVVNFEEKLNSFKVDFTKSTDNAKNSFNGAIKDIDDAIKDLEETKAKLITTMKHFRAAENKLEGVTIRKLTWGNATVKNLLDGSATNLLTTDEQPVIEGEVVSVKETQEE